MLLYLYKNENVKQCLHFKAQEHTVTITVTQVTTHTTMQVPFHW